MKDLLVSKKKYRPEIEGIRTIATFLIVIYHIWFDRVSGGIDVFFIISGFLITTSLVNQIERNGHINILTYIVGLAKRLIPLASLVIILIGIGSFLILFSSQFLQTSKHMFASLLFFENWRLAFDAIDYLERDANISPFQHFWSLSIQGQFYVIWPFIIIFTTFLAKKILKLPIRKTLLVVMSLVFIVSLSYSIYMTAENQPWAYFDSFARAWEFSVGGMFALLLPYLRFPKLYSTILGWLGLAIICLTGVLLPVSTVFPGYAALLPISGVLLILVAAENDGQFGVSRLLSVKPIVFMGGLTYGIYLWHWPLLVFFKHYYELTEVSFLQGILLVLLTVLLSYVSFKLIELPVKSIQVKENVKKGILVVMVALVPTILFSSVFTKYMVGTVNIDVAYAAENYPGSKVLHEDIKYNKFAPIFPPLSEAKYDTASFYNDKSCFTHSEVVQKCSFSGSDNPQYTIALVGGSHSGHWYPALEGLLEELNIQIDIYNHDGCRFSADDFDGLLKEDCMQWNVNLMEILKETPPDLVFTTANVAPFTQIPTGYLNQFKALEGITNIFAIRDNPRPDFDVPSCIERNNRNIDECSFDKSRKIKFNAPLEIPDDIPDNVFLADLTDAICEKDTCDVVVGNVLVYRDRHHLTAEYAKTLSPYLKIELQRAFEWLESRRALTLEQ